MDGMLKIEASYQRVMHFVAQSNSVRAWGPGGGGVAVRGCMAWHGMAWHGMALHGHPHNASASVAGH